MYIFGQLKACFACASITQLKIHTFGSFGLVHHGAQSVEDDPGEGKLRPEQDSLTSCRPNLEVCQLRSLGQGLKLTGDRDRQDTGLQLVLKCFRTVK